MIVVVVVLQCRKVLPELLCPYRAALAKAYYTYRAPHTAAAVALFVSQRERRVGLQPIGRGLGPCPQFTAYRPSLGLQPRTLTGNQTAIRNPGLPFNGLHPRNRQCSSWDWPATSSRKSSTV